MVVRTYICANEDNTIRNVLKTNQGHPGDPYVEVIDPEDKEKLNLRPNRFLWLDGKLEMKPEVVLYLDKNKIEPDGQDKALLTMTGAPSALVMIGGNAILMEEDVPVEITSSEEKSVGIHVDDPTTYSESFLTVTAKDSSNANRS